MLHITASLIANCFNKLYCTSQLENYLRIEFHLSTSRVMQEHQSRNSSPGGTCLFWMSKRMMSHGKLLTAQKSTLMMQDVVLLSTKVHPFIKHWIRWGKVNGRAKEGVHSVISLEIFNPKLLVCTLASTKEIIIKGQHSSQCTYIMLINTKGIIAYIDRDPSFNWYNTQDTKLLFY